MVARATVFCLLLTVAHVTMGMRARTAIDATGASVWVILCHVTTQMRALTTAADAAGGCIYVFKRSPLR